MGLIRRVYSSELIFESFTTAAAVDILTIESSEEFNARRSDEKWHRVKLCSPSLGIMVLPRIPHRSRSHHLLVTTGQWLTMILPLCVRFKGTLSLSGLCLNAFVHCPSLGTYLPGSTYDGIVFMSPNQTLCIR